MNQTYTATQIIRIGGREWTKPGLHRVYINRDIWTNLIGLETNNYKSGNISAATLDGEPISNSRASKILQTVSGVWLDCETGRIHVRYTPGSRDDVPAWIQDGIAERVAATEPAPVQLTTAQAAAQFGLSIRTIQRRCAAGKLTATKDARGRWAITA